MAALGANICIPCRDEEALHLPRESTDLIGGRRSGPLLGLMKPQGSFGGLPTIDIGWILQIVRVRQPVTTNGPAAAEIVFLPENSEWITERTAIETVFTDKWMELGKCNRCKMLLFVKIYIRGDRILLQISLTDFIGINGKPSSNKRHPKLTSLSLS